jgi:hypothetical protein
MKTVGPAISFLTSRWLLLQNEHLRASSPDSFLGIFPPKSRVAGQPLAGDPDRYNQLIYAAIPSPGSSRFRS